MVIWFVRKSKSKSSTGKLYNLTKGEPKIDRDMERLRVG